MFGLAHIEYGYFRQLPFIIPDTKIYLFKLHDLSEKEYEKILNKTAVYTVHTTRNAKDAHESYIKFSSQWKDPKPYPVETIQKLDEKWTQKCHFKIEFKELFGELALEILSRMTKILIENILENSHVPIKSHEMDVEEILKRTHDVTKENPNMFHPLTLMYNHHKSHGVE